MLKLLPSKKFKFSPYQGLNLFILGTILVLMAGCGYHQGSTNKNAPLLLDSIAIQLERVNSQDLTEEEKLSSLSTVVNQIRALPDDTIKRNAYYLVGREYGKLGDDKLFRELNNETMLLSLKLNDSLGIATSYFKLARYYYDKEQLDSAYQKYFLAERIYAAQGKYVDAGKSRLSMAIIQKNEKDYIGGEASSIKAIRYLNDTDSHRYLSSANSNLGLISDELGNYDKALESHLNALKSRKKLDDKTIEASSLNNIGLAYMHKGQYKKAISYYEKGLKYDSIFQKRTITYARLLDNLAYTKLLSGDTSDLPELFLRPLTIRDSIRDNLGAVTSHIHLAKYYANKKSLPDAERHAKIALDKAKPLNFNVGILEALTILGEISNLEDALAYSREHIKINDSLQKEQRRIQDRFARIRFETDIIEVEKQKATKLNKQLAITALSIAILSLIVYILIQRKVSKKELQFQVSEQQANEEIYNLMLAQQQKLEEGKQFEKKRISEDLHDGILGRLFGARLSLDSLNSKNDEKSAEARLKYIDELKSIEEEIRQISHDLNSTEVISKISYIDGVEKLVDDQCALVGLHYEFENDTNINWEEIPNESKVHLFRIVQESLQNIRKHANASLVKIGFKRDGEKVWLKIDDNGDGMDVSEVKKGIGLKNMFSRAERLNGLLTMKSEKGMGTQISVKINL